MALRHTLINKWDWELLRRKTDEFWGICSCYVQGCILEKEPDNILSNSLPEELKMKKTN